ncbi:cytochrome bc1 complex diheme cytochrome c subunit [Rhizohabitans arisaemae]|uniref:cytochrome bc1 complex diheme cytochrome c subunit n=1 Tax=Rhizohabitans arisaemae TaxID=2720610 RepID=UPI0024B0D839|nr:c-type cytochrome [Rhizohabitans arisaemae]
MKSITARRRHPLARYAVLFLALLLFGGGYAFLAPVGGKADASIAQGANAVDDIAEGKKIFEATCASCHGVNAEGTAMGPSLIGVGAASVDFQISTGRMPAAAPAAQMPRKAIAPVFELPLDQRKPGQPTIDTKKVAQVAAFIQSLGGGPTVPTDADVDPATGNAAKGGELFRANCIQCHNFVGSGGALTGGKHAPDLGKASAKEIYEAMITGPQAMPVFNDSVITPQEKRDMIAYILAVQNQPHPGGASLGVIGPVTEGLAAWVVGIGLLVLAAIWITAKRRQVND